MHQAAEVARQLLTVKAVKLNTAHPFTWSSGMLSPIYCDNRVLLSYPPVRNFIVDCLVAQSAFFESFDVIAGVATAGIPHGMLLADRLNLPFIYIRSAAKAHGRRNTIEGILHSDAAVLVVEDLISTGGSSLNAVESVREAGANVVGVLAIFQYGFGKAAHAFEEARVPFRTLTSYTELLEQAVAGGYVSDGDLSTLHQWRENPEGWGALFV